MKEAFKNFIQNAEWPLEFIQSEKFLTFIDKIPDAVIVSNKKGEVIQVNSFAAKLFQYPREEFLALLINDLVPERFHHMHETQRLNYFKHPTPRFMENRIYDLYAVKKDKSELPMDATLFALETDDGLIAINMIRDITLQKKENVDLHEFSDFDFLTKLANRRVFEETLNRSLARAKRQKHTVCIFFIDLDRFKSVNDQYGHNVGDYLLNEVAKRLAESLRTEDFIARFGGDEFVAIIDSVANEKIIHTLANPTILQTTIYLLV